MLNIKNPNAVVKSECKNCGYLNNKVARFFKCKVAGSCPAVEVKEVKVNNQNRSNFNSSSDSGVDTNIWRTNFREDTGHSKADGCRNDSYSDSSDSGSSSCSDGGGGD